MVAVGAVRAEQDQEQPTTGLRTGAVGLPGAVIMSAAIMGPAVSTFFNPQFSTPFSGAATPLVYAVCLGAFLITATGIMTLAGRLPSAGAFYTWVTRAFGARAGFVTGGLIFVAYALLPPAEIGLIGSYLQSTLQQEAGVNIPWWLIGLAPAGLTIYLAFAGVQASLRTALVLFTAEVTVVLLLAVIIVGKGGADGLTVKPLLPSSSPHGLNGLVTGFVFAALSFVGFESAATLSEEVRTPRRTVPRAILGSVLFVGAIYVFCTWAEVNGLGIDKTNALDGTGTPWNDLAATFAAWMKWPVIIASISSMVAVMVNSNTGVVRILFAMGRERLLPAPLARVSQRHRTPVNAVVVSGVVSIVAAYVLGALAGGLTQPLGGSNVYGYLGFVLTLAILPVYVLTNLASVRLARAAGEVRVLVHVVLPLAGAALMVGLLVGQIIEQTDAPFTWMPWLIVGYVVALAVAAAVIGVRRPDTLARAGSVLAGPDDEQQQQAAAGGRA